MKTVHLLVGVPGSGKTWVTSQLTHRFHLVANDAYIGRKNQPDVYVAAIKEALDRETKPVLAEAPFSISQVKEPLERSGIRVIPVFILEAPHVVTERYEKREKKPIPMGHLKRQITYRERATQGGHFKGTSEEVLRHLMAH